MRSLRSSLASSSLRAGTGRTVRQTESVTAYTSVPRQTLNLIDVQFATSRASGRPGQERGKKYCETSRQRKRRQWREKQEQRRGERPPVFTDWMFLPDLVLEHIFKFLSYKVGWGGARLVKGDHNTGPAGESLSWCGLQSVVQSVLEHGHLVPHHSHRLHHVLLAVQHHLQGLRGHVDNFTIHHSLLPCTLLPLYPSHPLLRCVTVIGLCI